MDHVCGHFRVHVQNNSEFRKIIGEPKIGKVLLRVHLGYA